MPKEERQNELTYLLPFHLGAMVVLTMGSQRVSLSKYLMQIPITRLNRMGEFGFYKVAPNSGIK
jgi:hypothetical protein